MFRRLLPLLLLLAPLAFPPQVFSKDKSQQPAPVRLDRDGEKWAEKTLRKLTLEEKIGQMFMLRAPAEFVNLASPDYTQLRDSIQKYHVGGLLLTVRYEAPFLYRNPPYEAAMFANQLQRESELPLIVAADFERGLAMRFYSTTAFPHAMAFAATGKLEYAETLGRVTAQESRAIGVEWGFFPVADVNSSPANPIINTRAFSEDPAEAGAFAAAYIKAARENGLLTTAKHFPGHGDTDTDSHLGLARVTGDRARLDAVELVPFRTAIAAGVDSVMVAHLTVPALESDPERIATTSMAVVTRLLRGQLGFRGVVVTDAMDMNALTRLFPAEPGKGNSGRAAVEAVKAGNDVILLPADLDASFNALLAAVQSGEISEERIDASVRRILRLKASVGLHKARLVDIAALSSIIARPENLAAARQVAEAAVTLVRDNGQVLPLNGLPLKRNGTAPPASAYTSSGEAQKRLVAVLFTDDVRTEYGRVFEQELRARVPDARIFFVDPRSANGMSDGIISAVAQARAVIAAVYVTPSAGKKVQVQGVTTNSVSLDDATAALLSRILGQAEPLTVVVALGSPYVAAGFPQARNYLCTFSGVPVSETAAVKALFGEIPIHGRLPVTIPGVAERGAGLDRPAQTTGFLRHSQGGSHARSRTIP
ncbi:MAG: glycoside hydrolase family 3 protein [Acidobacteriota bacterium]|nr:glycoside hydrolase family 3 protein [Acidobacteriota bacterium]